jgi:Protein of unknown function (DUF1569)
MKKLQQLLLVVEEKIQHHEKINVSVSASSVGWQIEHILLTIKIILDGLKKSKPDEYEWKFKLPRLIVFTLKKIPRGRAKAPAIVRPEKYDEATIRHHLQKIKDTLQNTEELHAKQFINHPFFGHLRMKKTITFLEIHTMHHLKIIDDIVNN